MKKVESSTVLRVAARVLSLAGLLLLAIAVATKAPEAQRINFFLTGVIFVLAGTLLNTVLKLRETVDRLENELGRKPVEENPKPELET